MEKRDLFWELVRQHAIIFTAREKIMQLSQECPTCGYTQAIWDAGNSIDVQPINDVLDALRADIKKGII